MENPPQELAPALLSRKTLAPRLIDALDRLGELEALLGPLLRGSSRSSGGFPICVPQASLVH
jgi:hypothetical protein